MTVNYLGSLLARTINKLEHFSNFQLKRIYLRLLMSINIVEIQDKHITGFNEAVCSVIAERKYLVFLTGPSLEMSREFVHENVKLGMPHFVALHNETVVGWCDISSLHRDAFAHSGSLGIGVLAEYRGQGIGKKLMEAAINKAKLTGLTRIQLTVREPNKLALDLYLKLGFVVEGVQRNAVRVDGIYENLICMGLLFN
jgi:ribosomal protein S18 acetylase RimI-like enzyme